MQYQVLDVYTIRELNEIVNDALNKGWSCQGGVSINFSNMSSTPFIYAQAIIKQD